MAETLRLRIDPGQVNASSAQETARQVAALWHSGGTVAFPTETVYGLGAHALDTAAVKRIFIAKERPQWDPLIVHVTDASMLRLVTANVPPRAQALIQAFWPGPLTLLLPRSARVPDAVTAGRPLVGVRMPAHPVAQLLIAEAGLPIAAPSANSFGRTSPTTAAHVLEDLDGRINAVVDGGPTTHGLESTVVDVSGPELVLYRPGILPLAELERVAGPVTVYQPQESTAPPESLPSPGTAIRHYAPRARLTLVEGGEEELRGVLHTMSTEERQVGVMLPEGWAVHSPAVIPFHWGAWNDPQQLARRLFAGLRELDRQGVAEIVCPLPPDEGLGAAIRDRLRKASQNAPPTVR